ncbi:MAG: CHRD domain-containing protein [Nitrospiria bacterium]
MRGVKRLGMLVGSIWLILQAVNVYADDMRPVKLKARGSGYHQVPSVSSQGRARFKARINATRTEVAYKLSYEGAEGNVFMAHIHFGQHFANGGISVWFCGDPASPIFPPPVTISVPLCEPKAGTLEGVFTADDLLGPGGQGIAPGEFEEFLQALKRGVTYINIHSDKHIPGEIRGQIRPSKRSRSHD